MFNNNLLMGAAAATSGASLVSVDNSALFNGTNYLARTPSSTGVEEKGTLSRWIYRTKPGVQESVFAAYISGTQLFQIYFPTDDTLHVYNYSGGYDWQLATTQVFRDIGWIHIVVAIDTTQAVEDDRAIIYINGERVTALATTNYPSLNFVNDFNTSSVVNNLGPYDGASGNGGLNGYAAETVWIDGLQLTPFSFGEYDSSGLYWTPKSSDDIKTLTFGTNGFYLDNTTNAQTDASGEGNNFSNNGSVTTTTLMTPTSLPRLLWNPLSPLFAATLSEGGTKTASSGDTHEGAWANTNFPKTGKWQTEVLVDVSGGSSAIVSFGIMKNLSSESLNQYIQPNSDAYGFYAYPTELPFYSAGTELFDLGSVSRSTYKYQICWDASAGDGTADVYFGIDNTFYDNDGSTDGNPATGSNPTIENLDISTSEWSLLGIPYNVGTLQTADEADWEYTIQSGYTALTQTNIAASVTRTASDTNKYFQTVLYEGNGATQRVGNFQPFGNSFTVGNGALFDHANNEILKRTNSSGGNETKWTFSTWAKFTDLSAAQIIFGSNAPTISPALWFNDGNRTLYFTLYNGNFYAGGGSYVMSLQTDPLPDDETQWMHIVAKYDSTVSTPSSSSIAIYVNGVQQGLQGTELYPGQNQVAGWNSANEMIIGTAYNSNLTTQNLRAYLAETVNIDGSALGPDSFGQTDTTTNRWIPKDVSGLTFGTNGFYLNYANSSDVGNDVSGNNNDWTNVNTVTQVGDTPTVNLNVISNIAFSGGTLSNGRRSLITGSSEYGPALGSLGIDSGKWYWEIKPTASSTAQLYSLIGISRGINLSTSNNLGYQVGDYGYYSLDGDIVTNNNGAGESYGASYAVDDIIGVALDLDNKTITFYKNNSSQGVIKGLLDGMYYAAMGDWNNGGTTSFEARFDSSMWSYSAPTDHIALSQDNIASSSQFISAFSWIKNRDATDNHMLFDRVRGATKDLHSNSTAVEVTNLETVQKFLAGGVQVGNDVEVNTANESYALWNFMMEATGSGSSLTGGDINTTALVDTTLGMAVGTYSGSNSNQTIETGLTNPKMVIIKRLNATYAWATWHEGLTDDYNLLLNTNAAQVDSDYFDTSQNTSTLFYLLGNSNATSISGGNFVYMAFAESQFISIGSYEGNGNANGQFIPTLNSLGVPIQPVWVLLKSMDHTQSWWIRDTARNPYNVVNKELYPDLTNAEATSSTMDIVTGGIKQRVSSDSNSSYTYIYMAIGTPIIDTDGRIIAGR